MHGWRMRWRRPCESDCPRVAYAGNYAIHAGPMPAYAQTSETNCEWAPAAISLGTKAHAGELLRKPSAYVSTVAFA